MPLAAVVLLDQHIIIQPFVANIEGAFSQVWRGPCRWRPLSGPGSRLAKIIARIAFLHLESVLQDGHRLRPLPLLEDEEEGSSRVPEGAFADGSRGLKPIPEDALRPSIDASNGARGAPNAAAARPNDTVSLCFFTKKSHASCQGFRTLSEMSCGRAWCCNGHAHNG